MAEQLTIDKAHSALLIMDYQSYIVASFGGNDQLLLHRASHVLAAARDAGLKIIYVTSSFRQGFPEFNPTNQVLRRIKAAGILLEGQPGTEIHSEVAPRPGEIRVVKRRSGAFSTTDLATILKSQEINCLLLTGIATSGVVLSTVRWAADADYELVVIEDLCADPDPEVHRVLTTKVFPIQSRVINSDELITALQA